MSFKVERDTFQQLQGPSPAGALVRPSQQQQHPIASSLAGGPPLPGASGKHPLAEAVGTALTGGLQNAGTKGYLAVCIRTE